MAKCTTEYADPSEAKVGEKTDAEALAPAEGILKGVVAVPADT